MKKNRTMKLACVLLALTIMTSCFVGGTFAKYTSTANGTGTATVAKWVVKLDDTAFTDTVTFDFTETWTDSDGNAEEDVVSKKLAPGTKGSFDLEVTNSSEVDAQFKMVFDFSAIENALPLTITYKVGDEVFTEDQFVDIAMNETKTVTVSWEWPFEGTDGDVNDTSLGKTAATYNLSATITVEQVD